MNQTLWLAVFVVECLQDNHCEAQWKKLIVALSWILILSQTYPRFLYLEVTFEISLVQAECRATESFSKSAIICCCSLGTIPAQASSVWSIHHISAVLFSRNIDYNLQPAHKGTRSRTNMMDGVYLKHSLQPPTSKLFQWQTNLEVPWQIFTAS